MGRKAGSADVAPHIRRWGIEGLRRLAQEEQCEIPDLFARWWRERPIETGQMLSRFLPRESKVSVKGQVNHAIELPAVQRATAHFLEELTGRRIIDGHADVVQDRSGVPAVGSDGAERSGRPLALRADSGGSD